jgi:hypothetical protein
MNDFNVTKREDVEKYLSPKLTEGTDDKEGLAFAGKIFKNIGKMAQTKFYRIKHAAAEGFKEGSWINNKAVFEKLKNDYTNLSKLVQQTKEPGEKETTKSDTEKLKQSLKDVRKVCDLMIDKSISDSKDDEAFKQSVMNLKGDFENLEGELPDVGEQPSMTLVSEEQLQNAQSIVEPSKKEFSVNEEKTKEFQKATQGTVKDLEKKVLPQQGQASSEEETPTFTSIFNKYLRSQSEIGKNSPPPEDDRK